MSRVRVHRRIVRTCRDCPHCGEAPDYNENGEWTRRYVRVCSATPDLRHLQSLDTIPDWCPLPKGGTDEPATYK